MNVDDSFYYYAVARNFAHGHFATFDGINRTNGFHPLWAWLITPVFWFPAEPLKTLAALKAVEFGLVGLSCAIFAGSARHLRIPIWFLAPLPLALLPSLIQGLEAAAYTCMLALALYAVLLSSRKRNVRAGFAGLALGLVAWARLEGLAFSVTFLVLLVLLSSCTHVPRKAALRAMSAVCAAVVALYFAYNRILFHIWVPVSGATKAFWSEPWVAAHPSLRERLVLMFVAAPQNRIMALHSGIVFAIVACSWVWRGYRRVRFRNDHVFDAFMVALCVAAWGRFGYSALTLQPKFADYPWYFVPVYVLGAVVPIYGCARLLRLARLVGRRAAWFALLPTTGFLFWNSSVAKVEQLIASSARHAGTDWKTASYSGAEWMNAHLPKGSVIGATDAGVLGYFSVFPVVNLDGLVNSAQYFDAQRNGWVDRWVQQSPITHVANVVPTGMKDGCFAIAQRARQEGRLAGRCTLLFSGDRFRKRRFYVWSYER